MKKTTLEICALVAMGLFSGTMMAQNPTRKVTHFGKVIEIPTQKLTPSGHIRCMTDENEAYLRAENPKRANDAQFEAWLAPKIAQIKADRAAGRNVQQVYNIPVVIHIIHNGDAIGTGENITDAQARSQINVLNQDYRKMTGTPGGVNSTGLAVDVEINFCLAQTDPSGNPTTGIVRHNIAPYSNNVTNGAGGPDWETRADVETMKTTTIWDPTQYLNMWTIRPGGNALNHPTAPGLDGLLGYAQFPSNSGLGGLNTNGGNANTDGVVAGYDVFGTMAEDDGTFMMNGLYNMGRTMTHEVGHWLGLRHIWGDTSSCVVNITDSNNDYCLDTPAAAAANYECDPVDSCPSSPGADMIQNYMDYTNDACMDTFTQDQKNRIIAVMQNATRRSSLNASTKCQTVTPIIRFSNPTGGINEGTDCNYTDVNFPVSIGKAATANAVVTFNVAPGGTATQGVDYQIMTPTLTFEAGAIATKNLIVRVFNDGIAEPNETFTVNMSLNANGGDAVLDTNAASMVITIIDNDIAPVAYQTISIMNENFETAAGWTIIDGDGDGKNWGLLSGLSGAPWTGVAGTFAYSITDNAILTNGVGLNLTADNYIASPLITIPAGGTASVSYSIGGYSRTAVYPNGFKEHYYVYFTPNKSSAATIQAGTVLENNREIPARASEIRTHDLSAFAGQTGYLVYRHVNSTDGRGMLMLDTVNITSTVSSDVQTARNVETAYQASITGAGVVYAKDATTSKVMADITVDAFNYGCSSVAVYRDLAIAGAPAVAYNGNNAPNRFVMAKTVTLTPETNNPNGNITVKFYFTEAEVAAWETATGNSRNMLRVIKEGSATAAPTVLGAFGNNVTLQASFSNGMGGNNGMGGVYYFGTDASLSASSFEILDAVSVYPNPANDILNISIPGDLSDTSYVIYNSLGQEVAAKKNVSQVDLTVNTSAFAQGIYFIKINKDGASKTVRFIKK